MQRICGLLRRRASLKALASTKNTRKPARLAKNMWERQYQHHAVRQKYRSRKTPPPLAANCATGLSAGFLSPRQPNLQRHRLPQRHLSEKQNLKRTATPSRETRPSVEKSATKCDESTSLRMDVILGEHCCHGGDAYTTLM